MTILQKCAAPGLFRLMLALLVFVHHASRLGLGTAAVFVFFILSGFWISTMWTRRYAKARAPYLTYILSRTWRILPVFILCSAITWLVLAWRDAVPTFTDSFFHQVASNLLMLGYNSLDFRANVPAWSLDIEMQFYVLAPLLVMLMARSLWVLVACAMLSALAGLMNATGSVAAFLLFFAIGVAASRMNWKPDGRLALGALLLSLALVVGCMLSPFRDIILGGAHPGPLHAYNDAACVTLALLMAPFALYTTGQPGGVRDGMYGDLSFIIYLLHWPFFGLLNTGEGSYLQRAMMLGSTFVVVMGASYLIWRFFDHPLNRLRAAWVAGRLTPRPRLAVAEAA